MSRRTKPPIPPKELRELWAKIPKVECKGLCDNSCGPIECSTLERRLIEDRAGQKLHANTPGATCSMLRNGKCSVYSARPVICRLWGVTEAMACPHGCKPERFLSDREALEFIVGAMELAGDDPKEQHRKFLEECPQEVLDTMRNWIKGAPDLGGAIINRTKANREFVEALKRNAP
jgi:Fe-S-cluster containining protein